MIIYDEQFLTLAQKLVANAEQKIQISTFKAEFPTSTRGRKVRKFFETLIEKKSQGVQVDFLLNWNSRTRQIPRANQVTMYLLAKAGILPKVLPSDQCCHAKMLIIDERVALVGSHNLSIASLTQNFETSCYLTRPEDVCVALAVYNAKFETARTPETIRAWKSQLPPLENPPKKK